MLFRNPGFLWALALGAIPIIIYLLMRYRSLRVFWGANYILERALERLKKKRYWDQILLIALRVLAILAVVLAFARPASRRPGQMSVGGDHHVLIIDTSYSMLAGEARHTRWDRGLEVLKKLAATWGRGDPWSLYLIDANPRWVVDGAVVSTPADTIAILDGLAPTETRASLGKAFEALVGRFPEGNVEVTVLADDQDLTWKGMEKVVFPHGDVPPIYWVNPPLAERENLAVTSVRFAGERVLTGHPTRVFVSVRNFGAQPVRDAEVEVLVDGAFFAKEPISLLPGQESPIHFDVAFEKPGSHYITARLEADALEYDNALSAGIVVDAEFRVLVLRDPAKQGKFDSAWRFLEAFSIVQKMEDEFEQPVFTMGPLSLSLWEKPVDAKVLAGADVVLIDGGMPLNPELVELLDKYVAAGGGLVLAADQNVQPEAWNELLGRAKLLPAPLAQLRSEQGGGTRFRSLSRAEFQADALRPFETAEDGDIANAVFYSWWQVGDRFPGAEVLARYDDAEPFLLRIRKEPGTVLMLTSGLNGWWNNLIVREFYVPLVFRLFSEGASGGIYPRTLGLREPARLRVKEPETLKSVTFFEADGTPTAAPAARTPAGTVAVAAAGSPRSGRCSMRISRTGGGTQWEHYGAQGPRLDSDLAAMSDAIRRNVTEDLGIVETGDWLELNEVLLASRTGAEWHHWLVIAALAVLVGEKLMERRFV